MNTKEKIDNILNDYSIFGFKSHQYPDVVGLWKEEQKFLIHLALSVPKADWLEVGSHCGGSACLLATAIRHENLNNKIYCVDIDFDGFGGAFKRNVYKKGKFENIVKTICCNSKDLSKVLSDREDKPNKIGLFFADGYHSFRAVVNEVESVLPYLVDNAIICLHDAQPYKSDDLHDIAYRAKAFYHQYMDSEMPDFDGKDLTKFHAMEQKQDFLILEAACYLADKYNLSFIPTPDEYKCDYSALTGGYKHGATSPFNSICALRYKV